jgi:hypothetical protein
MFRRLYVYELDEDQKADILDLEEALREFLHDFDDHQQPDTMICEKCQRVFILCRTGRRRSYCSARCKQAAYRLRRKST